MKVIDDFNNCTKGEFNTTRGKLDWKCADNGLFFQPSHGATDWFKNFLAIPFPVIVGGFILFVPFGVALDLPELRRIWCYNDVKFTAGYSRGGWHAVLTAFKKKIPCVTFGCPGVCWRPSAKALAFLASHVKHYENPNDVVCRVPTGYVHGAHKIVLWGEYKSPTDDVIGFIEWVSGHSPTEYRARLQGVER